MEEIQYGPFLEIWKPVKGWDDYDISSYGRVKSFKFGKEKILKPGLSGYKGEQYFGISLSVNNICKHYKIHRLVGQYIPNPFNLPQINHKDGNKLNNHNLNLEWVDNRENQCHSSYNRKTSSQYTGVSWDKSTNNWKSIIRINTILKNLGRFNTELEAYQARCNYEKNNNIINKYL